MEEKKGIGKEYKDVLKSLQEIMKRKDMPWKEKAKLMWVTYSSFIMSNIPNKR